MTLKAVLDSLEGVEEATAALYKKGDDGKHYLDISGVENHSGVAGLIKNREAIKQEKIDLKAALDKFGDLDPDEAREALKKISDASTKKITDKGDFEALKKQMGEEHTKAIGAKDTAIGVLTGQLETVLIEGKAIREIADAGGSVKLLLPHVISEMSIREVNGKPAAVVMKDGEPRVNAMGDPIPLSTLIAELKEMPDFRGAFSAKGKTGSGSGGDGTGDIGVKNGDRPATVHADAGGIVRVDPAKVLDGTVQVATE